MSGRRDFLKVSAVLGGALGGGLLSTRLFDSRAMAMAPKPLRILILGGTGFIGPHQVRYALARGHRVTLFNRGRTNAGMFTGGPNLEVLLGDREPKPGHYEALKGREWDAVIDNPARRPRWVREAAAAVKGHAKQYVCNDIPGADETAAVSATDTPDVEDGETFVQLYGPLKALCEREAEKRLDRRRRRPNRPVQLLASAHRTRRRGAGAAGGRSGVVHRRARCGRVDDPVRRRRDLRRVQRDRPGDEVHREADAQGHSRHAQVERHVHVHDERVPARTAASRARMVRSAGLDRARGRVRGLHPTQHREGAVERPHVSSLRRHGEGDDRLLQGADARAAGSTPSGYQTGPRERSTRRLAREAAPVACTAP